MFLRRKRMRSKCLKLFACCPYASRIFFDPFFFFEPPLIWHHSNRRSAGTTTATTTNISWCFVLFYDKETGDEKRKAREGRPACSKVGSGRKYCRSYVFYVSRFRGPLGLFPCLAVGLY